MPDSNEQLFDQFADLPALEEQRKKVLDIYADIKKGIIELNNAAGQIDGAKGFTKLGEGIKSRKKATDELSLSVDSYNRVLAENAKLEARLAAMQSDAGKQNAILKQQAQELAKARREEAKEATGAIDAYKRLEKQYEEAARKAQNLIIEKGRDAQETKEAIALAQKLGLQLRDADASVLKFQRRVGDYANSLADGFEIVRREIARLQREKTNFEIGGDTRGAEAAGARIKQLDDIIKISFDDTKNFSQVVKSLEKNYSTLAQSGNQSNEFLQAFAKFVAEAKDQADDLKTEIKALSSDTRKLDLAAGSITFLADAFQTVAGAAQLAGLSEEDAAAATAKLTAVMSVSNGIKGLANELTTKGTAANKAYAFVQGLVSVALDKTATSAARAKAALGLLGIAVTVVGAIVIALSQLSKKQTDAQIRQQALNDVMKEGYNDFAKTVEQVESLRNSLELAKKGMISKKEVVEEYNSTMGKTTGQVKSLDEVEQQLVKNADAYLEMMKAKAIATAALAKASTLAVEAQLEALNPSNQKELEDALAVTPFLSRSQRQKFKDAAAKDTQDKINTLKNQVNVLIDLFKKENNRAGQIALDNRFSFTGGFGDKNEKKGDDEAQKRYEAEKLALERLAEQYKNAADDEKSALLVRLYYYEKYVGVKKKLIDDELNYEKSKRDATANDIFLAETKAINAQVSLLKESSDLRKQLNASEREALKSNQADQFDERVRNLKEANDKELLEAQKFRDELLAQNQNAFNGGVRTEEQFNKQKIEIEKDYEKTVILSRIRFYEELLKANKAFGFATLEQEAAIAELRKSLAEQNKPGGKGPGQYDELIKGLEVAKTAYQEFYQFVSGITNAIAQKQLNSIQEQIDAIDEQKKRDIERIAASQDSEEKKAARIKVIEAKAQSDKEALEKKKRDIQRRQASFEKAASIMNIILNTAQAVTKALALGPPQGIIQAAIAGALGAGQLAVAVATPLPKFFRGKGPGDNYEGLGIVGDAGRELKIGSDGSAELFNKETITNIKRDDIILPNYLTEYFIRSMARPTPLTMGIKRDRNQPVIADPEELELLRTLVKGMDKMAGNKIAIYNHPSVETDPYYQYHMKR